ncbi:MAG: ABC transporter substrate binding protein [Legionellales bacterium]|jgi:putative ABC transport system substrate-binding protein
MIFKNLLAILAIVSPTLLLAAPTPFMEAHKKNYTVAITLIDESPEYTKAYQGVLLGLKEEGFIDGQNITINYQNAKGDLNTAYQIAHDFVKSKPDIIIPISTPSAQAVVSADESAHIPVVFAAVMEPFVKHSDSVTGVYGVIPLEIESTEVGYLAGRMAGIVLGGKSPGKIDIVKPKDTQLLINAKTAEQLNLK